MVQYQYMTLQFNLTKTCSMGCMVAPTRPDIVQPSGYWVPTISVNDERERRFCTGYRCPRCGSDHIHGHGRYRDRKRYRCAECGRTFNDRTGSPLSGTHYPERWGTYIACMAAGYSLRRTARVLNISLPTAFYWRHKLLAALIVNARPIMVHGIVELDEVYVLESQKGSRNMRRPPRQRGTGRSVTRGPARNRLCVLALKDRIHRGTARVVGMGELHHFWLGQLLDKAQFDATELCVDNRQAYWILSRQRGLPRRLLSTRFEGDGIYHHRNVDRFLTHFKKWLLHFRGVASRYLEHYVQWFVEYAQGHSLGMCPYMFSRRLLQQAVERPLRVTNEKLLVQ